MVADFEALQHLHSTTLRSFTASSITLVHYDELSVELTIDEDGAVSAVGFELLGSKEKNGKWYDDLTRFLAGKVEANVQWSIGEGSAESGCNHAKVRLANSFRILRLMSFVAERHSTNPLALAERSPTPTRTLPHAPSIPTHDDTPQSERGRFFARNRGQHSCPRRSIDVRHSARDHRRGAGRRRGWKEGC